MAKTWTPNKSEERTKSFSASHTSHSFVLYFDKSLELSKKGFEQGFIDRLTHWLTDSLTDWLADWSDWLTGLTGWLVDWLPDFWLTGRLTYWLNVRLTDRGTSWLPDQVIDWLSLFRKDAWLIRSLDKNKRLMHPENAHKISLLRNVRKAVTITLCPKFSMLCLIL